MFLQYFRTLAKFHSRRCRGYSKKKSDINYIKNILGAVYDGPRPLLDHADHRYVYQVIGLKSTLDVPSEAKFETFENSILENIVAYGAWTGAYKRDFYFQDNSEN